MTTDTDSSPWKRLEELVEQGDVDQLIQETDLMGSRESGRAISRLNTSQQQMLVSAMPADEMAEIINDLSDTQAVAILGNINVTDAANILTEMETDDAADLIQKLDYDQAEEILDAMPVKEANETRRLSAYDPAVAGGLMNTLYIAFPSHYTTREVIEELRNKADDDNEYNIQYTYVIDDEYHLVGVLTLRDLLLTPSSKPISTIMIKQPFAVSDQASLDELWEHFQQYTLLGLPVLDAEDRLIGVVGRDDVIEALGDRIQSDYMKTQGIIGGEELRSMPLRIRVQRRLSWLSANILLNIAAASVIAIYQDTLAAVIALAVFLPIISDMSGNAGFQAAAVSMRELALGLVKPVDIMFVAIKEASLGLINGFVLGVLIAAAAWIWQGNVVLGLVAGSAMMLNTLLSVLLGGLLPLILRRFNLDPALASGPILTTITDMCGFFFVLSFATACLAYL